MKCFVVLSALLAVAAAEADPWMGYGGYGYGAPAVGLRTYAVHAPLRHAAPAYAAPARVAAYAAPAPVIAAAPAYAAPAHISTASIVPTPAAPHASQYHKQDEFGNYEYGYQNPNSAAQQSGNTYTGVRGSYSYVDGYGLPQKVQYVADALGYRATGTNFPTTAATLGLHRKRRSVIAAGYGLPAPVIGGYGGYGYAAPALTTGYGYGAPALTTGYGYGLAHGGYAAPALTHGGYAAGPVAVVKSAPAAREAILTRVKLTPGHAEAYRVY